MKFYDEDAFWGDGEEEILTVSEVIEYLTVKELSLFTALCDKAEKRKLKADLKARMFHRGYDYARDVTNSYKGFYFKSDAINPFRRGGYTTFDDNDWDDLCMILPEEDLF